MLFAKQGAFVHIIELDEAAAVAVVKEIIEQGGSAFAHACDIVNQQQVINTFEVISNADIL